MSTECACLIFYIIIHKVKDLAWTQLLSIIIQNTSGNAIKYWELNNKLPQNFRLVIIIAFHGLYWILHEKRESIMGINK